jgi:predicted  nucleic acid-binding Zn-ribbon protein
MSYKVSFRRRVFLWPFRRYRTVKAHAFQGGRIHLLFEDGTQESLLNAAVFSFRVHNKIDIEEEADRIDDVESSIESLEEKIADINFRSSDNSIEIQKCIHKQEDLSESLDKTNSRIGSFEQSMIFYANKCKEIETEITKLRDYVFRLEDSLASKTQADPQSFINQEANRRAQARISNIPFGNGPEKTT